MRQSLAALGVKGSILLIKNNKPWLNYATANQTDTSYLINSVQKSLTATMVMRAVQDHRLALNNSLAKYYPAVPGANKIQLKNLLSMSSGLDLDKSEAKKRKKTIYPAFVSDQETIKNDIAKSVWNPKKFGKWHYSSLNYVLLSGILSKVRRESYEQLFNQTYIQGLGLKHTAFYWAKPAKLKAMHYVPGHFNGKKFGKQQALNATHGEPGAGSIVMSNQDLARTLHAVLAGKLLTKSSRKILFTNPLRPNHYNGGFYNFKHFKAANGGGVGYYTFFRASPDASKIVVLQTNHTTKKGFKRIKHSLNAMMPFIFSMM